MASYTKKNNKNNTWFFTFLAFSVVVIGGIGYFLSQNMTVNLNSHASVSKNQAVGFLLKNDGKNNFNPVVGSKTDLEGLKACGSSLKAMMTPRLQVTTAGSGGSPGYVKATPQPTPTPKTLTFNYALFTLPSSAGFKDPKFQSMVTGCIPVQADTSLANQYVGKEVLVTGAYGTGVGSSIFYATGFSIYTPPATTTPRLPVKSPMPPITK